MIDEKASQPSRLAGTSRVASHSKRRRLDSGTIGAEDTADGQLADPAGWRGGQAVQRVQVGRVPPLAEAFARRSETAPGVWDALIPGLALAIVPGAAAGPENGLGASGKTQCAVHLAESLWRSAGVDALIWISATSRASVLSGLAEGFAAATGIEPAGTAESVAARCVAWLAETSRPWLVVLDDLSDTEDLEGLWPGGPAGRVLITTRLPGMMAGQHQVHVVPVGFFSAREALGYLTQRTNTDSDQRRGAVDLIRTLDGEPLALAQACAVIADSAMTCRDYRDNLLSQQKQIQEARGESPTASSVTWILSVNHAEQMLPDAAPALAVAALLDGHGIPATVFTTAAVSTFLAAVSPYPGGPRGAELRRGWTAVLALEQAGLVWISREQSAQAVPMVGMSPAVQAEIRPAIPDDLREHAVRAAADALLEVWPAGESRPWTAESLRASAISLQREAADALWAGGCHELLLRLGRSLDAGRFTGPAVRYWQDLAATGERLLGRDHPHTVTAAARLADAYLAAGRGTEALRCYQQVLARYQRTLGGHVNGVTPDVTAARIGLGRALLMEGNPADAAAVLRAAAAEAEQVGGASHPDALRAREELAAAYRAEGQVPEAVRLLQGSLADREHVQGPRFPDTMTAREHLAAALLVEGRIAEGLSHAKRLLGDREGVLGAAHPDTIAARALYAAACYAAGRMTSALENAERARADSEQVLGVDHRDTLTRCLELAQIYSVSGRAAQSQALLGDTAVRCSRVLPAEDPLTLAIQRNLAGLAGRLRPTPPSREPRSAPADPPGTIAGADCGEPPRPPLPSGGSDCQSRDIAFAVGPSRLGSSLACSDGPHGQHHRRRGT